MHQNLRLPAEAYDKHRGEWIALSEDRSRIIASEQELDTLEARLESLGVDPEQTIFDRVEDDDQFLGGGELH